MFRNEFIQAAVRDRQGDVLRDYGEGVPVLFLPGIRYFQILSVGGPGVSHRHGFVVFSVDGIGDKCKGGTGDYFFDKYDASSPAVVRLVADIKAEVHLLEVFVEGDWEAFQFGVPEHKTHETDEMRSMPGIQFGAVRQEWPEQGGVHGVIQHGQFAPFGAEEYRRRLN